MRSDRRSSLLILVLLLVVLTAAAQDVSLRPCRTRAASVRHRAPLLSQHSRKPAAVFQGDRRQLVVLASFSDQAFAVASPVSMWNPIFNEEGYHEGSYCGSVHDYFYDQSYGKLNLSFDLYHTPLSQPRTRYRSTSKDDENSQYLVQDIVDQLALQPIDWSQYDWDADGYVDQLLIIYAGMGQNDGGGAYSIWPHQWWLSEHVDPDTQKPCQPRTVTGTDGKTYTIDAYCAVQERGNNRGSFGTICHEYTHCFGFPDFYSSGSSYVRQWDLMDYGNNNGNGYRPCGYSAHERWLMGWLTPTELTAETAVASMVALADGGEAYLIRNDGHADEYYIVENRQQTGWDSALPGSGLLVFHIDYDEAVWTGIDVMPNPGKDNRYTLFHANNSQSTSLTSGWAYPYKDNDALTNTSSPAATLIHKNADGTLLMSKPITEMALSDGLASFKFMGGETAIRDIRQKESPSVLYNLGPVSIIRCADGQVRKVRRF